jgi:uncharacterized protein GlcG (DUF336 family)
VINAVVAHGGNLEVFVHQDDSVLESIEIAQFKAGMSARFPFST